VTKLEEAIDELQRKHYDMVIVMMGVDKNTPLVMSRKLKGGISLYSHIFSP
jgi:BarA-like signal transduction histidine kinase